MSDWECNTKETKCVKDDQAFESCEQPSPLTACEQRKNIVMYDKQQLLVEKANDTFRELCKTLENEQTKLMELEERRKKLQEEMLLLKAEIEEEKQSFNMHIVQSVAGNLSALNDTNSTDTVSSERQMVDENLKLKDLYTCYEEEENQPETARNLAVINSQEFLREPPTIEDHVQYIRNELHYVLSQCISERCSD